MITLQSISGGRGRKKALLKTISWRGISLVGTTGAVWMATGRMSFAASVGMAEIAIKFGGYYLHERFWDWIGSRGVSHPTASLRGFFHEKEEQQCQQVS
jgi:uncharacterized membrane protein